MARSPYEMAASDVITLYAQLTEAGVTIWIDGGWGVDALLGEQTRRHSDLDIVVESKHEPALRRVLGSLGYSDRPRADTSPWNYVMGDGVGREVDVHVITLDDEGKGIYGPEDGGQVYPASSLTGIGAITGHQVQCIAAEDMVRFHVGYEVDETDYRDVSALCTKFGIKLPEDYARFAEREEL
jgi:lincosamide nucleotidyltransferase A/C/D/E